MPVRGIPTDISLRGAKKWNTLFNFSLRSCKRMLWYNSRKEKGILTLNSGCWHWNQMEIEMKLQPDTNSKKISHIVPDLQTSFSNYITVHERTDHSSHRYDIRTWNCQGFCYWKTGWKFFFRNITTVHWLNNKIETKYLASALGSQRGQTEIEHRIY